MEIDKIIETALAEDVPRGDITTDSLQLAPRIGRAHLLAREDLVLSGQELFSQTFRRLNPEIELKWYFNDGDVVIKDQVICQIVGALPALLKGERTALNFLGHLSGVATLTRCFVRALGDNKCKILDTRKTLPGLRLLEKQAVRHGGGVNHRMNLSEAILLKENHLRFAGGLREAVLAVRKNSNLPIEVEVTNLDEVRVASELRVSRIMLDNMSNELTAEALKIIPPGIEVEASGNMDLERVRSVAELGVHFISVGALTHSAPTADLSMLIIETYPKGEA